MEPVRERSLEIRGAALFYRLWPASAGRRVLVLIHGFGSNSTRWRAFAETTSLRRDWHILCPDLRGHGHSPWRGRLRSEDWVDDMAAILAHEALDEVVVGGHCLGANVALRFARRYPGQTSGLVLVEPMFAHALGGPLGRVRRLRTLLPWLSLPPRLLNALGLYRRQLPVLDLTALDRETRERLAATGDARVLTERYGSIRNDLRYMPTAAYLQALGEVVRPLPPLAGIHAPALAMLSQGGRFGDPAEARAALEGLPRVEIRELEAEHWIPTEQPEAMAAAIEGWLAKRT